MSRGRVMSFSVVFGLGRFVTVLKFFVLLGYPYPILQLKRGGFSWDTFFILACAH